MSETTLSPALRAGIDARITPQKDVPPPADTVETHEWHQGYKIADDFARWCHERPSAAGYLIYRMLDAGGPFARESPIAARWRSGVAIVADEIAAKLSLGATPAKELFGDQIATETEASPDSPKLRVIKGGGTGGPDVTSLFDQSAAETIQPFLAMMPQIQKLIDDMTAKWERLVAAQERSHRVLEATGDRAAVDSILRCVAVVRDKLPDDVRARFERILVDHVEGSIEQWEQLLEQPNS
jgi:hypothetical protein